MDIKLIQIVQIIISVMLMAAILLQNKGASAGGLFGGSNDIYRTKRGAEKTLFRATIILAIIFMGLAIAGLFVTKQ